MCECSMQRVLGHSQRAEGAAWCGFNLVIILGTAADSFEMFPVPGAMFVGIHKHVCDFPF